MSTGVVVPAYVHPQVGPAQWRLVERLGRRWACVVVNVADGPGGDRPADPAYVRLLGRLAASGVRAAGYVDLDYGARDGAAVCRDVVTWRERYGVDAVFFDRFPCSVDAGVAAVVARARAEGATLVVANPGVHPVPGALVGVDVCVTFEGDWAAYRRLAVPAWAHRDARPVHLVHGVPPSASGVLRELVARRRTPCYATQASGANPWRRVSTLVTEGAERHRPEPDPRADQAATRSRRRVWSRGGAGR